jgi:DNA-damage-inducible protein D
MKREIIIQLNKKFEDAAYQKNGLEYWMARDIQVLLDYTQWRNFLQVIDKAKTACLKSGQNVSDHFADVSTMVRLGSGSERDIDDMMLTRYACYLIAQNGDPRKDQIAFAQSYFAIQTRKQELLEERIALIERMNAREKLAATEMELSGIIYQRGVDNQGFARIRSKGDEALFGGRTTFQMKKKLNVPDNRPLADFLPTITIKAKDLAAEITNFNIKKKDLTGESPISSEHTRNNKDVRGLLAKSGIRPEELPPEEDIKKLKGRVKTDQKKLAAGTRKLSVV